MADDAPAPSHADNNLLRVAGVVHAGEIYVGFQPGPTVLAKVGEKLLDIAEASQVPIESGCRMGMCGSDPVRVLEGEENLSPMRSAERRTLERLGLGAGCRMACVSRVQGPVVVDPRPGLEGPTETDADGKPPLAVLRESLRDLDDIVPDLEDLGARHAEYGAQPAHYPVVGEVLIAAMTEVAGDEWKPEYTAAWQEAYGVVQNVMLSGAASAP
jgi:ferredoxin